MEENKTVDMVNSPPHYTECSLECIDIMEVMFGAEYVAMHCVITAYKYMHRHKSKGNTLQDLKKAEWYLNKHYQICRKYDIDTYDHFQELSELLDMLRVDAGDKEVIPFV